jgi:hypothetical protein
MRLLSRLQIGDAMNLYISIIAACAGTFVLANTDLALAAYPRAEEIKAIENGDKIGGEDRAWVQDSKAWKRTMLAANDPQTNVRTRSQARNYPCMDYNPKAHTCGRRRTQEPDFMRNSKPSRKS